MFRLSLLTLIAGCMLGACVTDVPGTHFVTPPRVDTTNDIDDNPQYKVGDTKSVQWESNVTSVTLTVRCLKPDTSSGDYYYLSHNITDQTFYSWHIDFNDYPVAHDALSSKGKAVCYLNLWDLSNDESFLAASRFFTILKDLPSSTSARSTSSAGSPKSTLPPQSTDSPEKDGNKNGGNNSNGKNNDTSKKSKSNGAVIGGAVGGTVGGLLVIGAIGFLLYRRHRQKNVGGSQDGYYAAEPKQTVSSPGFTDSSLNHGQEQVHEIANPRAQPQELP